MEGIAKSLKKIGSLDVEGGASMTVFSNDNGKQLLIQVPSTLNTPEMSFTLAASLVETFPAKAVYVLDTIAETQIFGYDEPLPLLLHLGTKGQKVFISFTLLLKLN
jgi:hypothetical protein